MNDLSLTVYLKGMVRFKLTSVILIAILVVATNCSKEEEPPPPTPPANQPPTCVIVAPLNDQEILEGETIVISVDATDSDGSIVEVRFSIDGIGKSAVNSFPYNYNWETNDENAGPHTIKATSIDDDGASTSDEISVVIVEGSAPEADFVAGPNSGTPPLSINFTDQSTNFPTSHQWSFGDGNTSTEQNPFHIYTDNGLYTVTLTATNDYGSDSETKIDYILVSDILYTDQRDGQTYYYETIGDQTWFSENLNYETPNSWHYENDPANGDIYGRLYTWDDAVSACPAGWHLPTDNEWKDLEMHLGMSQIEVDQTGYRGTDEGIQLKNTFGWNNDGNGSNSSGFTALPGAYRNNNGSFEPLGSIGVWWTATESSDTDAWFRDLWDIHDDVYRSTYFKTGGFSIRCVKN